MTKTRQKWLVSRIRPISLNPGGLLSVSYAHRDFPKPPSGPENLILVGGAVKYQYLNARMPHSGLECNLLYAVSSSRYAHMAALMHTARAKGIKVAWNQDGTYVPFVYGPELTRKGNATMAPLLHQADYVFYQSEFARMESDHFLGQRQGPCEILYNAVDTKFFCPAGLQKDDELVLLVAGTHNVWYRLETAISTLQLAAKQHPAVRMIVAGGIHPSIKPQVRELVTLLGLEDRIDFLGPYTQRDAPEVFRQAHVYLHTQYNDVCPTVIIEAMACGLPVVYSRSGGTPELVGEEGGYGVPCALNWDEVQPPDPHHLAEGILVVAENRAHFGMAARERAVSQFDLEHWLERHREVFEGLLG